MRAFYITMLVCSGGLFLAALIRWARTPDGDSEAQPRADMTWLCGVVLVGEVGAVLRSHYTFGTPIFWLLSALLLPVAAAAILFASHLVRAYRQR